MADKFDKDILLGMTHYEARMYCRERGINVIITREDGMSISGSNWDMKKKHVRIHTENKMVVGVEDEKETKELDTDPKARNSARKKGRREAGIDSEEVEESRPSSVENDEHGQEIYNRQDELGKRRK